MRNVYLVVADARRLLILLPEVPWAAEVAVQLCARFPRSRCHWVILEQEAVDLVQHLLDDGERDVALWVLQQQLLESGPVDFSVLAERQAA